MCLRISNIHKENKNKPFIAEKDIIVFKALDHYDILEGKKSICTPYQFYPIDFIDGKCVMKSDLYRKLILVVLILVFILIGTKKRQNLLVHVFQKLK